MKIQAKPKYAITKLAVCREQNRLLVAALKGIVDVMNSREAGTNVFDPKRGGNRWMGLPEWEQVDEAAALLGEIETGVARRADY